jgi:hypothetical protein
MSSTYSTNLALELIGTGDQAGNWGSTTNTNLGTLIEQAISGYTTYSCTGGTDTLTMTNGASATARNMYLVLSNLGGGTLVVPSNTKLYFVYNSTSSAITVKVSGQTGVSVPAGAKVSLVCNGTDVVVSQNYIPTLISPALTGTPTAPTASAGTSTTQIATTAFVTTGLQSAYPVGSIYMSTVSTNPNTLFGFGTWVTFGSGRVLISQDGTYSAGSTGGAATATLSTTNLPSHTHTYSGTTVARDLSHTHTYGSSSNYGSGSANAFDARNSNSYTTSGASVDMNHTHNFSGTTDGTGSGTAFSIVQPYISVYMWNRTV